MPFCIGFVFAPVCVMLGARGLFDGAIAEGVQKLRVQQDTGCLFPALLIVNKVQIRAAASYGSS